jgi:hypothetical protein
MHALVDITLRVLSLTGQHPTRRRTWVITAVSARVLQSVVGMISGVGVIGSARVGQPRSASA